MICRALGIVEDEDVVDQGSVTCRGCGSVAWLGARRGLLVGVRERGDDDVGEARVGSLGCM